MDSASSGIGAGTAEEFAKKGSWLSLCGRNAQSLADVAKKCHEAGVPQDKILQVVGDLSQEADTIAAVEKTVAHFGRLDVLVNSAGILTTGGLEDLSLEDYDQQMNINTRAVLHIMKLSLPHLLKTKGNIVNVSSITGIRAFPGVVAYNMSKAALDHLTRTVALEVASRGVRVNAMNPGVIVTDIHRRAGMDDEKYKAFLEHGKTTHAMGHVGEVKEVAKPIVFLASDDASFITGQTLAIDGGRGVMCPR
ncbi:unnamed protein product [Darwinula stevensoni]|uniref:Ketoreductase domain-containing protein n=1 Tax=Darwinula stevensoni TaxID=69355 RepID=A0A7R9AFZ8_9CRUS|nr:unnamed protein product [Darwinula stevensoni]CAG0903757.1 unnamed protein product [Darwinula stevensoni]